MNMKNIAVMEVEFGAAENTHFYNFLLNGNGNKYLCKK
jgi:hypothetical protein